MTKEENNFNCKTHPDAPHGFVRNASHSEDRYVCECEFWEPPEQNEPVAYINVEQRKLEWAKYTSWETPTVVNLPKIPLYTTPPAASDLLNALKRIVDEPNNTMSDGKALKEIIRIARLAIAKATGEQP